MEQDLLGLLILRVFFAILYNSMEFQRKIATSIEIMYSHGSGRFYLVDHLYCIYYNIIVCIVWIRNK